ncbi:MAG: TonB-dependent receptor, partial [Steroidobacteraceae bacterium]
MQLEWHRAGIVGLGLWTIASMAWADAAAEPRTDTTLEEVVVFGRGERLIGEAQAASEGTVGGADLGVRPLLRVAELLEVVPGLIAAQHSGSGKANQYFLRGFNLDHGTDFAAFVDDVPMNLRTHGHGQGYLDVNGLIPEVVDRIDFRKGPYRADIGDNALAGASFLNTVSHFARPFVSLESGQYGWQRVAAGGSTDLGAGQLTLIGQWKAYDGPWELSENLKHVSAFAKYSRPTSFGRVEASLSSYDATWDPTEQIPERAIGTSICADAFCALDTSATGKTVRHIATLRMLGDDWRATVYGQFYDWDMFSDSTYDFQIHQWDKRFIYGARGQKEFKLSDSLSLTTGGEARYDDISKVQVDHTSQRAFIDYVAAHKAQELSLAGFAEGTWHATDTLRVVAGLRGDYFDFSTTATQPGLLDGNRTDSVVSPKVALAWQVSQS